MLSGNLGPAFCGTIQIAVGVVLSMDSDERRALLGAALFGSGVNGIKHYFESPKDGVSAAFLKTSLMGAVTGAITSVTSLGLLKVSAVPESSVIRSVLSNAVGASTDVLAAAVVEDRELPTVKETTIAALKGGAIGAASALVMDVCMNSTAKLLSVLGSSRAIPNVLAPLSKPALSFPASPILSRTIRARTPFIATPIVKRRFSVSELDSVRRSLSFQS